MSTYETIYRTAAAARQRDERAKESRPGYLRNASAGQRHEAGLAAVVVAAKAEALEEFAVLLRERYPEDVFRPLTGADHKSANDALAGRAERTHITRDSISADMMRRAAAQADEHAADIREGGAMSIDQDEVDRISRGLIAQAARTWSLPLIDILMTEGHDSGCDALVTENKSHCDCWWGKIRTAVDGMAAIAELADYSPKGGTP